MSLQVDDDDSDDSDDDSVDDVKIKYISTFLQHKLVAIFTTF